MPNYGYNIGQAWAGAGEDIGKGIAAIGIHAQKQRDSAEGVQGLLDLARRYQIPDPKTGKPKSIISDEHYQYIQRLIDQKKYKAAGAAEAALGIGKDMIPRLQIAAAKQQAAIEKQRLQQQIMQQGPIVGRTKDGVPVKFNTHTNNWEAFTAKPTDSAGNTVAEQQKAQASQIAQQSAEQQRLRTVVDASLKGMNLPPQAMFDPDKQQVGGYVNGRGFLPLPSATDTTAAGPAFDPTHIRIGYRAPAVDKKGNVAVDRKGKPLDPGDPGTVLTLPQFNGMRDAMAVASGPQTSEAWKWLNTSPETTQTDYNGNPWTQESIKQYQQQLPGVRKRFQTDIAQGYELPSQQIETKQAAQQPATAAFSNQPPVVGVPQETEASEPLPGTAPPTDSEDDTED